MNKSDIADKIKTMQALAETITWADVQTAMDIAIADTDTEGAHSAADDVLCLALLKASPDAARVIRTYLSREKWYACSVSTCSPRTTGTTTRVLKTGQSKHNEEI